jgi:outer membrane protein
MRFTLSLLAFSTLWLGAAVAAETTGGALTLDEALRVARAHHPQLQAARAQTEVYVAKVGEARAPLLPQVSSSLSYTRSYGQSASSTTSGALVPLLGGTSSNAYAIGATASQLLYDFGQTTGRWRASQAILRSQQASERNLALQVSFNLRSSYYAAATARALLKVAEETVRNQDAHLRQIQGFVEAGTRPEIDLAQARTDRANAQVRLINAQVAYDASKAVLNQAMGVERGTAYDVAEPESLMVEGEDGGTDDLMPTALGNRPDLQALSRQIEAQELTAKAIRGAYAPSLGVSTSVNEAGRALDDLKWGWNARLSLNWQLFGGGITDQQLREARANTAALRAQYELQRQQIRVDVEQARLAVHAAKAAILAAHEAALNARVRLTLAEGRYQAGVGSVIELGDSQVAMTAAAAQEVQAITNLASARARLLLALGQP